MPLACLLYVSVTYRILNDGVNPADRRHMVLDAYFLVDGFERPDQQSSLPSISRQRRLLWMLLS